MSRSDQVVGLSAKADTFLKEGKYVKGEVWTTYETAWSGDFPLYAWHREEYPYVKVFEYVQTEPWSSGPCYFLSLLDSCGEIHDLKWTDEEIEKNL